MAKLVNSRQGLDAQLAENLAVKKEFDAIPSSSASSSGHTVYKLVGPVLLKQETAEAKANVDRRLEFLRGEMCVWSLNARTKVSVSDLRGVCHAYRKRLDEKITGSQSTIDNKRLEVRLHRADHSCYMHAEL